MKEKEEKEVSFFFFFVQMYTVSQEKIKQTK